MDGAIARQCLLVTLKVTYADVVDIGISLIESTQPWFVGMVQGAHERPVDEPRVSEALMTVEVDEVAALLRITDGPGAVFRISQVRIISLAQWPMCFGKS